MFITNPSCRTGYSHIIKDGSSNVVGIGDSYEDAISIARSLLTDKVTTVCHISYRGDELVILR